MIPIVARDLETYATDHSADVDPLYEDLRRETAERYPASSMQVGRLEGRFLKLLALMAGARLAVEVGTYTGYSALSVAEALPADGRLITFDADPEATAVAQTYFARAPWGDRIELRLGDARERLSEVDGPVDFAFIDADKTGYRRYWDILVPRMRPGGIIAVDNVLWSGHALAPREGNADDRAIAEFNDYVAADQRVEAVMLTVRDGITVARVR